MTKDNSFFEIAAILGMATVTGIVGQKLRQPLVIMFLVTGVLAGPAFLGIIHSHEQIALLAHIGIALLLFIVGLKLDLKLIKTTGPVALATGIGQIVFTALIGFMIALMLGMAPLSGAYVAVALTFSSTIIVVKLLSDKKEIDSLHGQITLGFLIVQDIAAILALVALTTLGSSALSGDSLPMYVTLIIAKGLGLIGGVGLLMKYVLPYLTKRLAHSLELLTLFAITWAIFLGAGSELLGFSKEAGAFLAGISLASTEYRDAIGTRLTSLRDFLLLFFFIDLGARLNLETVGSQLGAAFIFSFFVLIGKPLIMLIIMGLMGYRRRTGFLAGITVAQISEFSLIVAALGLSLGHISEETMGLITLVGVITIFLSGYLILYSYQLYQWLSNGLRIFEKRTPYREAELAHISDNAADVILVGLGNYGGGLAEHLLRRKTAILGVDFDPKLLEKWRARGVPVLYSDMTDPDIHDQLPLHKTSWVINTVRSQELNLALLNNLKQHHYPGKIALTATNEKEATLFEKAGAHLVLRPFEDATEQAADALAYATDFLPKSINWPVSFIELRIRSDASVAGKTLIELPLSDTGITVLSVSRGGRVFDEPGHNFRIFPADRLILMGTVSALKDAETLLNQPTTHGFSDATHFELAEITITNNSPLAGKTIQALNFRQKFGATLVGIRREALEMTQISPTDILLANDHLIVIGKHDVIVALQSKPYL